MVIYVGWYTYACEWLMNNAMLYAILLLPTLLKSHKMTQSNYWNMSKSINWSRLFSVNSNRCMCAMCVSHFKFFYRCWAMVLATNRVLKPDDLHSKRKMPSQQQRSSSMSSHSSANARVKSVLALLALWIPS